MYIYMYRLPCLRLPSLGGDNAGKEREWGEGEHEAHDLIKKEKKEKENGTDDITDDEAAIKVAYFVFVML